MFMPDPEIVFEARKGGLYAQVVRYPAENVFRVYSPQIGESGTRFKDYTKAKEFALIQVRGQKLLPRR